MSLLLFVLLAVSLWWLVRRVRRPSTLVVIEVPGDIDAVRVVLNDDSGSWQAAGGEAIEQSGSDAGEGESR